MLERALRRHEPRLVAVLGVSAYRTAFGRPRASIGLQPDDLGGRPVWGLPNPSGLNAHYKPAECVGAHRALGAAIVWSSS